MSSTGELIHTKTEKQNNRLTNIYDGCTKDGQWGKSIFEYKSSNANMLPIADVGVLGTQHKNEYFGIKLGAVCFY